MIGHRIGAMPSSFIASPCRFDGDTIVSHAAWSNVDQIAALTANTVDENEREVHQVLFMNNEVRIILVMQS